MFATFFQVCKKVNCSRGYSFKIPLSVYDQYGRCLLTYD